MRQRVDEIAYRCSALAEHRQRAAEQNREQQHLQHVASGKGAHRSGRDQLHQKLDRAAAGELAGGLDIGAHRLGVERFRVHVHADTGLEARRPAPVRSASAMVVTTSK